MYRMTHEKTNGKAGYWSPNKKEEVVNRLATYENTGLEPRHVQEFLKILKKLQKLQLKSCEDIEPASKEFLDECREVAKKYKKKNDGWIPVEKELPPNAKQKGAFCPKYQVMTKYGVTEGWYNPDYESWFCLFWFVDNKFTKPYIDFEYGDVPKRVQIEKGIDIVLAWRPMPEPYKPERREGE